MLSKKQIKELENHLLIYDKPLYELVEEVVTKVYNKALDDVIAELEKIDFCEYASFTLGLVKEITEKLKGAENG